MSRQCTGIALGAYTSPRISKGFRKPTRSTIEANTLRLNRFSECWCFLLTRNRSNFNIISKPFLLYIWAMGAFIVQVLQF